MKGFSPTVRSRYRGGRSGLRTAGLKTENRTVYSFENEPVMKKLLLILFCPAWLFSQSDIYFINSGVGIERIAPDGTERQVLVAWDFVTPQGIALDLTNQKLYWTDWIADKIQRSNLDGSGVEDVLTTGLDLPEGIEIDPENGKMYWVDSGTKKIQRANLDGSEVQDLVIYDLVNLDALALDLANNKMYWTEWGAGAAFGRVKRANTDGSGVESLVSIPDAIFKGIALDLTAGKIYWTDCGYHKIQRSNLNGTAVEDLVSIGLSAPNSLDLDRLNKKIYWSEQGGKRIRRSNFDGSMVQDVLSASLDAPQDIVLNINVLETTAVVERQAWPHGFFPNPVQNQLTINGLETDSRVTIFGVNGQRMPTQAGSRLELGHFPAGQYLAEIRQADGRTYFFRFNKI